MIFWSILWLFSIFEDFLLQNLTKHESVEINEKHPNLIMKEWNLEYIIGTGKKKRSYTVFIMKNSYLPSKNLRNLI